MRYLIALVLTLSTTGLRAQELNCQVDIQHPAIINNVQIFQEMKTAITRFMNNTKWTTHEYDIYEKIECNITITINERPSANSFKGDFQFIATRPALNSSYKSQTYNYLDEGFEFGYVSGEPLQFTEGTFTSNLVSLLAYHGYLILGYDYDSYEKEGGQPYFVKARSISNNALSAQAPNWNQTEIKKRNRFWIAENIVDARFKSFRAAWYNYHRNGVDKFHSNVEVGRQAVMQCLQTMLDIHNETPNSNLVQIFFDVKRREIMDIFDTATSTDKEKVLKIIRKLDIFYISKYEERFNS